MMKGNCLARQEEDLLGVRDIPNDAYYGIHTLRASENFKISAEKISDMPDLIYGLVCAKKASAIANMELGSLPKPLGECIVKACDVILGDDSWLDQFITDAYQGGAGTSINMNINEVIANVALELMGSCKGAYHQLSPNDHVNMGQSTNCAYPTGLRIAIYKRVETLINAVECLKGEFKEKSLRYYDVIKMGRTQLQDAVPMTVGQEFMAFGTLLDEEIKNLRYSSKLLLEVNLGGTAIGTGLNTADGFQELAVKHLSELTGYECTLAENLIEATSDCGAYVTVHGALKRLAVKLSKICNDLRLLSSGPRAGLNEINLPQVQAGSSIMPAKVNPVIPEVVNQVCFKVIGNDTTVTLAAEAGQLQLNVMEPVICQSLFESMSLLDNACISLANKCVKGITVNKQVCESYVLNSVGLVTYLNPYIGHHLGDSVGKVCIETGRNVKEVVLEKNLLTEDQVNEIFSMNNLIYPKYKATITQS